MIDAHKLTVNVPAKDEGAFWVIRRWPYSWVLSDWSIDASGSRLRFSLQRRRWMLFGDHVEVGQRSFRGSGKWWVCEESDEWVRGSAREWLEPAEAIAAYYDKRGVKP